MNTAEQRSPQWFRDRIDRVTGSRIGAILGLSPFASRDDVMRDMVREHFGAESEFTGNVATEYGSSKEATAKAEYEMLTGNRVTEAGLIVHPDYDWLAASPDGLIAEDGGVEFKAPYSRKIKPISEAPHYEAQVRLCMECCGRDWWDFYVWTGKENHRETVQRDPAWLNSVLPELGNFMAEYRAIIADESLAKPYLEPKEVDLSDRAEWIAAAEAYQTAKKAAAATEKELKAAKAKITDLAKKSGYGKVVGCGVQAYSATRQGSVDYTAIPELKGVDLDAYRKAATTYWTVR